MANYIKQNGMGRNATGYNGNITTNFRSGSKQTSILKIWKLLISYPKKSTWNYNSALNFPIYTNNPYWDAYRNYETDSRNRFIGNATVNYEIADWLDAYGRVSADSYYELQEERRAVGSVSMRFGLNNVPDRVQSGYIRRDNTFSEYNFDLMLKFNKKLVSQSALMEY